MTNENTTNENTTNVPLDVNPLLARAHLPGQTYPLPSGGLFYKSNELSDLVKDGEVTVNPMTAYDEILLKTPDLLLSGKAIEQVFKRCMPQVIEPLELFGRDVDYLMTCLRIVTYGEEMEIRYTHDCEDATEHSYVVDLNKFITTTKNIDPTKIASNYEKTLSNGQAISLNPVRLKDIIRSLQAYNPNATMTPEEEHEDTIRTILSIITSVDLISDQDKIREWLEVIPAGIVNEISSLINETSNFGPDFVHTDKCKDCNSEFEVAAPINPLNFFM